MLAAVAPASLSEEAASQCAVRRSFVEEFVTNYFL